MKDNKLIAEFMGYKVKMFKDKEYFRPTLEPYVYLTDGGDDIEELQNFHTSWDWLMPVVEKIESLDVDVVIDHTMCAIDCNGYYKQTFDGDKIKATYKAVVEFIKWYNAQI